MPAESTQGSVFKLRNLSAVDEPKMFNISQVTLESEEEPGCELRIHVHTELWKKSLGSTGEVLVSTSFREGSHPDLKEGEKHASTPVEETMYACHGKVYSVKEGRGISFGGLMCTLRSSGREEHVARMLCPPDLMGQCITMQFRPGRGTCAKATKRKREGRKG